MILEDVRNGNTMVSRTENGIVGSCRIWPLSMPVRVGGGPLGNFLTTAAAQRGNNLQAHGGSEPRFVTFLSWTVNGYSGRVLVRASTAYRKRKRERETSYPSCDAEDAGWNSGIRRRNSIPRQASRAFRARSSFATEDASLFCPRLALRNYADVLGRRILRQSSISLEAGKTASPCPCRVSAWLLSERWEEMRIIFGSYDVSAGHQGTLIVGENWTAALALEVCWKRSWSFFVPRFLFVPSWLWCKRIVTYGKSRNSS